MYSPAAKMIELSEVVSALNYYSAKLQTQEKLGYQVFECLRRSLRPRSLLLKLTCVCAHSLVGNVESVYPTTSTV